MTLADTPISRLESFLTDSSMTRYVDTVVMRTDEGFRAASSNGAVDFCEANDGSIEILAESGDRELIPLILDVFQHSHFSSVDTPVQWRGSGWACAKAVEALEGAPER